MSQIRQVKEATDIVQVIGERVALQKSGSYYRGLCPFHSEKSPSFFVNEQLQRYKCFGCGETGDVFNFLEKYEGMTFYEALKMLADQAGITLKEYVRTDQDEEHDKLLEILSLTREYYHYLLTKHKVGEVARQYLKSRGTNQQSIELFQLGYAMESWDGLISYLHKKKKYSLDLLEKAGLVVTGKGNRSYDRFRGRLMFPLTNARGQVVGFSGRLLDSTAKEAKYINSPETALYHKSKLLFGYSQLYQFIRKEKSVVVVEGEFDALTSSQAHVNNVVAIKGSALTADHAKLLDRTVESVLLALDTDNAGVEATKKAIEALKDTKLNLRVVVLPDGKDPDELIKQDPKAWRQAIKSAETAYSFLIEVAFREHDSKTPEGKRLIMEELAPVLSEVDHAVELEFYTKLLSERLNVKESAILADLRRFRSAKKVGATVGVRRAGGAGAGARAGGVSGSVTGVGGGAWAGAGEGAERAGAGIGTSAEDGSTDRPGGSKYTNYPTETGLVKPVTSKREKLERFIFYLLLNSTSRHQFDRVSELEQVELNISGSKQLIKAMSKQLSTKKGPAKGLDLEKLNVNLPEDLQQLLFSLHTPENLAEIDEKLKIDDEWTRCISDLKREVNREKIKQISEELAGLDKKKIKTVEEKERQNELLRTVVELRKKS